jgi:4-hydroxy-3-polyprenylbenzoate decarboxylase
VSGARASVGLAITGASGAVYGLRLLGCLLEADETVHLMFSDAARAVLAVEEGIELPGGGEELASALRERTGTTGGELHLHGREEWTAPVASGSNAPRALVVCPCSMGTLAAIASGASNNLIERAADVALKERRQLILVPRETPLSAILLSPTAERCGAGRLRRRAGARCPRRVAVAGRALGRRLGDRTSLSGPLPS